LNRVGPNHFERAFESWLRNGRVGYVGLEQQKRAAFGRCNIKSFDFLIYPQSSNDVGIIEVKGRTFKGQSMEGLKNLECWVTIPDVQGLLKWEEVLGKGYKAVFVFMYELAKADVDTDGRRIFEYDARRYVGLAVRADEYRARMRARSPKWQTVTLAAADFRELATDIGIFLGF
jgi:hypothetical protein